MWQLFKKKKIKYLGRGGLIFNYEGYEFFIDSEMSFTKDIDIVLYGDDIKYQSNKKNVEEPLKEHVIRSLVEYLETEEKLKVDLFFRPSTSSR